MGLFVRSALPADIPVIQGMLQLLLAYHGEQGGADSAFLCAHGFSGEDIGAFLLAEIDGQPAGFAQYARHVNYTRSQHSINLDLLYTLSALRGQGVAKALMQSVIRRGLALGCTVFRITASKENAVALATYRSWGLKESDRGGSVLFKADAARMAELTQEADVLA